MNVDKIKRRAKTAFKIWRVIAGFIIFLVLLPTFLAANDHPRFFLVSLSLTVIAIGLAMIVKQSFKKKLKNYVERSTYFLLIGASLLIVEGFLSATLSPWINFSFLAVSALCYAFGLQRLGLSYIIFIV